MATIDVRGYANKVEAKKTKGGKPFVSFSLGVKQKEKAYGDKPESVTWANFFVNDYSDHAPVPPEKAFVTVQGYLKVQEKVVDGVKRTYLLINATSVQFEDKPEQSDAPKKASKPAADEKEPWED